MKSIKRAYYYLFYKFYRMSEAAPSRWLSDWKASIVMIALEVWILLSLIIYYIIFIDRYFKFEVTHPVVIIPGIVIVAVNYILFIHKQDWKDYVQEFDQLPKTKNRLGSWLAFTVVLLVLANFAFSLYLMNRIDWTLYGH